VPGVRQDHGSTNRSPLAHRALLSKRLGVESPAPALARAAHSASVAFRTVDASSGSRIDESISPDSPCVLSKRSVLSRPHSSRRTAHSASATSRLGRCPSHRLNSIRSGALTRVASRRPECRVARSALAELRSASVASRQSTPSSGSRIDNSISPDLPALQKPLDFFRSRHYRRSIEYRASTCNPAFGER
jgi:hypothetical protein